MRSGRPETTGQTTPEPSPQSQRCRQQQTRADRRRLLTPKIPQTQPRCERQSVPLGLRLSKHDGLPKLTIGLCWPSLKLPIITNDAAEVTFRLAAIHSDCTDGDQIKMLRECCWRCLPPGVDGRRRT